MPGLALLAKIWLWVGPFVKEALATSGIIEWSKTHKAVVSLTLITIIQFMACVFIVDQHRATNERFIKTLKELETVKTDLEYAKDKINVLSKVLDSIGTAAERDLAPTHIEPTKVPQHPEDASHPQPMAFRTRHDDLSVEGGS